MSNVDRAAQIRELVANHTPEQLAAMVLELRTTAAIAYRSGLTEARSACERPVYSSRRKLLGMPVTRERLPTREECLARIADLLSGYA